MRKGIQICSNRAIGSDSWLGHFRFYIIGIMRSSAYSRLHAAMGQALQVAPPPSARSPVTLPRLHMTPVQFIGGCRGTVSPLQVAAGRSPRCSKPALEPTGYLPARRRCTPHRNREQALLLETSAARNGRRRRRLQLLLSGPPVRPMTASPTASATSPTPRITRPHRHPGQQRRRRRVLRAAVTHR